METCRRAIPAYPEPVDLVHSRLEAHGSKITARGNNLKAQCPAHADRTASLNVDWKAGKTLLWCHAGCTGESRAKSDPTAVLDALGLTLADLFDDPP